MKLAAFGVITVGIGVALGIPGLIGIGLFWVVMGLVVRANAERLGQRRPAGPGTGGAPAVDGRTFALGTLMWIALGVPSLLVGAFEIGIDAEHADWRWLPIAVGGLAVGIAVLGAVMYGAGSATLAATGMGGVPDKPATLWIRSVRETGTFINERPRLEFGFLVEPDASTGLASYEVTKSATVPFTAMGSLRVGDGFRATVVGPEKPTAMTIDWDSPVAGAATTSPTTDSDAAEVSSRLDELDQLRRDAKITDEEYQAQRQRILGSL